MSIIYKYLGPQYKLEKGIAFFAWSVHLIVSGYFLMLAINYYTLLYKHKIELPERPNFYWPFLIFSFSFLINFFYWLYLLKKKQRKEEMQWSLFFSILLFFLPFALFEFVGAYLVFGVYRFGKPSFIP